MSVMHMRERSKDVRRMTGALKRLYMYKKGGGYGKKLYLELEERLKKQNILNMYACIAYTDNEDGHLTNNSMQFHEHMGFRLIGTFKKCGYKFDKWYDMIWMEKFIGEHKVNPDAVTKPEI